MDVGDVAAGCIAGNQLCVCESGDDHHFCRMDSARGDNGLLRRGYRADIDGLVPEQPKGAGARRKDRLMLLR